MNTPKIRLALLGIAVGILLALLLAPQTRWVVREQLVPSALLPDRYEQQKQEFVRRHPNDYQVQLAGQPEETQLNAAGHDFRLEYARSLVPRFPANASLRANILRYTMFEDFHLRSDADFLLGGQPVPAKSHNAAPPTPTALAAFEADAAAGERLDPDNAYFPFMLAAALFCAHQDQAGLAAIRRASTKHVWREYFDDEVEGRWRINDAIYGGREDISSTAISAALLFPHYAGLRAAARVVAYKAILDEQAGQPEAGLAKRQALARCGELMGIQSTVIIGNLVGVAINEISRTRPGGSPPLKAAPGQDSGLLAQKRLDLYCDYVTRIGHPEAAVEARSDYQAWQQIHLVMSEVSGSVFGSRMTDLIRLAGALMASWVLLPNALSLLVFGLIATGLSRLPQIQVRRPLPAGAAVGFWSIMPSVAVFAAIYTGAASGYFPAYVVLLVPLIVAGLAALVLPGRRRLVATGLLAAGVTLGAIGLLGLLVSWQLHGGMGAASTLTQLVPASGDDSDTGTDAWNNPRVQTLLWAAFEMAIPLLLAIVLSIVSRVKRVPVSAGLAGGFRAVMPPLVCGMMLVYGGLVLWTVQQEARANYGLERSLHGEGQYLAQTTGQAWPK